MSHPNAALISWLRDELVELEAERDTQSERYLSELNDVLMLAIALVGLSAERAAHANVLHREKQAGRGRPSVLSPVSSLALTQFLRCLGPDDVALCESLLATARVRHTEGG